MSEYSDYSDDSGESDRELQVAFEKGLLKPGLNVPVTERKFPPINNTEALKRKLKDITLKLPWLETLTLTCEPAPLAPELKMQLESHKTSAPMKNSRDNEVLSHDDFAREMLFYRLGQSAVMEAISNLHSLNVPTRRPDDYFAEMAKSDDHMHKIRKNLQYKENATQMREKAKKMRELKKLGKKIQIEKQLQRQQEKRTIMDQLKKVRKGKAKSVDYLDDEVEKPDISGVMKSKKQMKQEMKDKKGRREMKNKKFGLNTGRKKGWKRNTAKDLDGPLESAGTRTTNRQQWGSRKWTKQNQKRPGKNSRVKSKQKQKSKR